MEREARWQWNGKWSLLSQVKLPRTGTWAWPLLLSVIVVDSLLMHVGSDKNIFKPFYLTCKRKTQKMIKQNLPIIPCFWTKSLSLYPVHKAFVLIFEEKFVSFSVTFHSHFHMLFSCFLCGRPSLELRFHIVLSGRGVSNKTMYKPPYKFIEVVLFVANRSSDL